MRAFVSAGVTALLLTGAAAVPASAFPVDHAPGAGTTDLVKVQFQAGNRVRVGGGGGGGHGGGGHGGGFRPGFGGGNRGGFGHGGWGGRGYHHGGGYGAGVGAGLAGLAAGAIIGGAIANQNQPYYEDGYYPQPVYADPAYGDYGAAPPQPAGDAEAYCTNRYKSYDPSSGTFLGYDGARHPCP